MLIVRQYSIVDIQDEVRTLVSRGLVGRKSRIFELSNHFSDRQWPKVEQLLQEHDYVLRDPIIDLVGKESWMND